MTTNLPAVRFKVDYPLESALVKWIEPPSFPLVRVYTNPRSPWFDPRAALALKLMRLACYMQKYAAKLEPAASPQVIS